ncbi:monovalent cation/H+ antiporter subunit A [Aromatoleum buckelii]|uniref:Monovalent cation/H+ antiporter subunit A n=1 Tax=Aromatoleum buckelii TaxID=200254 RepID=A0ABX1N5I9_9RHOO|nr:monovalent cation/H+ antiporter subunit A [Aromatoleum buckelii]MCK0510644.1 monovalent cation/H+ antiporter subunit A [Aromatoleum buckelii]
MSLALIVMLPFVGAVLPALLGRAGSTASALAAFSVSLVAFVLLLSHAPAVFDGDVVQAGWVWLPGLGLNANLFLDGLGFLFAVLILGIGLLIIAYTRFYLPKRDSGSRFHAYLLLFQGAMLGIVLSDNVLLLLIFWELTSLSSFLLIGYSKHLPEARQGARMALAVTTAGGLSMIAGMLILGDIAGSFDLTVILQQRDQIHASPHYLPALLLILGGCFTKSAQFPFHFWLPHAMAAPTPVSAYLHSATMVKAGVFLLARLWPVLSGTDAWFYVVATTGLATMLIGAVVALFEDELKALLAFSTISHLGLVVMLFGFGTPLAAVAGVFHILNHATFKAALFMTAGIIDHEVGSRDIRQLGGLATLMPVTATLATLAAASMAGVPLLNGFLSKEMMLDAAARTQWAGQGWAVPLVATVAAMFSVAYSFRYLVHVFFVRRHERYAKRLKDPSAGLWLPPLVLVAIAVLIGLFPAALAGPLVATAAAAVVGGPLPEYELALWHGATPALAMSVFALAAGLFLLSRHARLREAWQAVPHPQAKPMFDAAIAGSVAFCRQVTADVHNGSLRRYLAFLVGSAVFIGDVGFFSGSHAAGVRETLPATPVAIVAWLLLVGCCTVVLVLQRQRVLALVSVGVIGLIVAFAFLYLSAPDLALTQIGVEVVTVVLMLLALNVLPKTTPAESGRVRGLRDATLAVLAGLGSGGAAWAVMTRDVETLSGYYLERALPEGGGANVVNVILVDFRGFDTFGEIIVLGIAALTVFALLDGAQRLFVRTARLEEALSPRARDRRPLMLAVVARIMLPLALVVAAYIFLRGHHAPGGGFVAGLIVAIALIMQYIAGGAAWAEQRLGPDHHVVIGAGVLVAAATGVGAWVVGHPFLTSAFGHVAVPLLGVVEFSSAMAFDAGVFLTVVGAVMLILATFGRIDRRDPQPAPAPTPPTPRLPDARRQEG